MRGGHSVSREEVDNGPKESSQAPTASGEGHHRSYLNKLGLKNLPLLPAHATVKEMAKAAVAVYEKAVDEPDNGTTSEEASNGV